MKYVTSRIDWSKRPDYIRERHYVETAWADGAVTDLEACWLAPDPASTSGVSVRVIGYSGSADAVLTAILLPGMPTRPSWPMVNGWE